METNLRLEDIADGALQERFLQALAQVAGNIMDPNTEIKQPRRINIELTFKPLSDNNREQVAMSMKVSTKLEPPRTITGAVGVGVDQHGVLHVREPKQQRLFSEPEERPFANVRKIGGKND